MILEFDGIEFGYGGLRLLSGIYMRCETGKVTGLLGRNGSGKSTLLKIVFGALRADVSSVRIDGVPVFPPAFSSGKVAYLPQDSFLPPDLKLKNILRLYNIPRERILINFPELEDLDLKPDELSGGLLRLFEVLIILHGQSVFCLLDEPFTGLSPAMIERIQEVIQREKQEKGIVLTDHLFRQVMYEADHLYLLSNGTTYYIQNPEELSERGYLMTHE